jgi:hypothetical protein
VNALWLLRVNRPRDEPVDKLEARLVALVRGSPVLMRALRAARNVNPPDWGDQTAALGGVRCGRVEC